MKADYSEASHSDESLRAGRSGDRIPVGARYSATVQTGPGAHPTSCASGQGVAVTNELHAGPRLKN